MDSLKTNARERALNIFPVGSNGEYDIPEPMIPVMRRGKGGWIWDTEDQQWLDMTMGWGSVLVGHAHPKVIQAAVEQAPLGANFAAVNERSLELAERIQQISPWIEKIRFVASGTEATMLCLRVARAATGKSKILKFEGAYHGQHPEGVTSLVGSDFKNLPQSDDAGTGAPWTLDHVLVAPYNDLETTRQIIESNRNELAGVIVEPLHRCLTPKPGFLQGLKDLTTAVGIPLVFDEVVTGFRLSLGGAAEYYGVQPDLVAYGKGLGGGFPIGAYAGADRWMQAVEESRLPGPNYAWSASTTGGNPISCAAALATLSVFSEPGVYQNLHESGKFLRDGMRNLLEKYEISGQILGDGPLAQIAFSKEPVVDHRSWKRSDRAMGRRMMLELLEQKVFLNPMGTKLYFSILHTREDLQEFLNRLDVVLGKLQHPVESELVSSNGF